MKKMKSFHPLAPRSAGMPAKAWRFLRVLAGGLLALSAAFPSAALAQTPDIPTVVSPLRVEADHNGVNLVTGRITIEAPVLSVPAAPNLRFDRVQNSAPYVVGRVSGQAGEPPVGNWTVHTGGATEGFQCSDWVDCDSTTGTGSYFRGPAGSNGANGTYRQAGTGAVWHFTNISAFGPGPVRQSYASNVTYPTGEGISYTYDTATTWSGQIVYRPNKIASTLGYHISVTYQGSDLNNDPGSWATPATAAIYRTADPATPLRRLTYSGNTITDSGSTIADTSDDRVITCTGCIGALGVDVETQEGSLQLPGEGSAALQVTRHPTVPVVTSLTKDGVPWTYSYGNLRSATTLNSLGYLWDSLTVTGPNGFNQIYNFVPAGPYGGKRNVMTSSVDSIIRTTSYLFDANYRPTQITYPEGNRVNVVYDDDGNVTSRTTTPKPGSGLSPIVESAVYPTATCVRGGGLQVLCYRPLSSMDGMSRQTDYAYNDNGQLTEQLDPADSSGVRRRTSITYAPSSGGNSRRSEVRVCADTGASCGTNALVRTQYEYWGETNLVTLERRMDGATGQTLETSTTYDSAGRLLTVDSPLPGSNDVTYSRYDAHGRKNWEIGPLAATGVRTARYIVYRDSDDKPVLVQNGTVTDPSNPVLTVFSQTDFAYDVRRNAIRETVSASGSSASVVQRTFDDSNRLDCEARRMNPAVFASLPASACTLGTQGSQGPDRITHNIYDAAGQVLQIQQAYGTIQQQNYATYTYSSNGKQVSLTDANGNLATMTFDGHDRQIRWNLPLPGTPGVASATDYEAYTYDAAGNRLTLRRRDGLTLGFQYDQLNRMIVKTVPERAGLDATHTRDVHYGYDLRNQPLFARFDSTSGEGVTNVYDAYGRLSTSTLNMDGASRAIGSVYDPAGRRTQVIQPDGLPFTYTYDAADRLTGVYQGADTSVVLAQFTYNPQGLPATRSERYGSSVTYGFDAVGRLTSQTDALVNGVNNVTLGFGYNPASQITSRTRSNDAYAWTGGYNVNRNYSVNGLNQYLTAGTASFGYDANGNLTTDGTRTFTYDVENRLAGASGGVTLRYDPLGRLYEVTGPSGTKRFVWDGDALVNEYTAAGTMTDRYVHGANTGADDPLVWYDGTNVNFLHADHQGSIIGVTSYATVPSINAYDEWGIPKVGNVGRFQYTGQIWLPDLGMYHYKARIYSPTLGRFLQVDPIGYNDQVNLYAYVGNDPVNRIDPTGTADLSLFGTQDNATLRDVGANFDVPGFYTVASHGSPVVSTLGGQHNVPSDRALAAVIGGRNRLREPVFLLGCRLAGDGADHSRNLARLMGVPVIAATNQTWWARRGDWISMRIYPRSTSNPNNPDRSRPGHLVVFTPDGRRIDSVLGRQITGISKNTQTGETIVTTIGAAIGTRIPSEERYSLGRGR